ncbi:ATP-binding protein [Pseudomonas mangrovi]|uniref:histidine kinase n=1 Tax=Pseudomonas mangrovi TaxID=2161748 RepID=A0A2T5PE54_9PSED|nr:ATP-binding protein [Pseudomonas mangrovi]PTU76019.1 two-component sensor histidine kinase [Pseudomonas mangrovi]
MNSIFLRIYGGMLAALVLVAMLGAGAVEMVNEKRTHQHRERLANGTFRLMADNLEHQSPIERRRALVLWGRLLGLQLELHPLEILGLDSTTRNRLFAGQIAVRELGAHSVRVYALVSETEKLVLTSDVEQISEQLARATIYLLIDELVRYPRDEQPARLAELKQDKGFGFDLRLVTLQEANLDQDQRRRVEDGDTVMALGRGGDAVHVFAGIAGTPWVLELGPLYQMNPYPPQVLILIGVLGLTLIGLIVYLLVRQLERRLAALEKAATRISRGRLEVRAPVDSADSVGRLALAFNAMTEHLQRSLGIQREMVRAVSHELRTPVARLRFGLEMLGDAESDTARDKYMTGMDNDIQELDRLLDEMLTYARLEQGAPALDFQPVDLNALIDQVMVELAPLRAQVNLLRGEYSDPPGALAVLTEAEPRYLQRALQNLVSNALRHAESRVWVSCWVGPKRCRLTVEDDGPGVPEEDRERIFRPFIRLDDSRTRASGGHGLGLSIVRRIIYWHNGKIEVSRSAALGGASFSLVWPRQQQ